MLGDRVLATSSALLAVCLVAGISLGLANALVLTAHKHGHLTMDAPGAVQKFHSAPTPRVGGIAIYSALVIVWAFVPSSGAQQVLAVILLASLPAIGLGLLEDVSKQVSVPARLLATLASGAVACYVTGIGLNRLDIGFADRLLSAWPVMLMFTAFAVGGVANAVNIIDGFHGLASGTVIISLAGLALVAAGAGDVSLALAAVIVAAAIAGFWMVNFPWGRLFLGDGGAYFCGFALAWLCVELLARNKSVSPWAAVLLCAYPTIEVGYSVWRRRKRRLSPGAADRHHLHSLVAMHVVQPRLTHVEPTLQNAAVSVLMWGCALAPVVPAVLFPDKPAILLASIFGCVAAYHFVYRKVAAGPGDAPQVLSPREDSPPIRR